MSFQDRVTGPKTIGVIVYYKCNYDKYISLVETDSNGYIWLKISKEILYNSQDAYICVCYIPPEDSKVYRNADSPLHKFCFFRPTVY